MKKFSYLFILFILTNCFQSNTRQVRIVDAQGNPAKINKMIPKFNEEQMAKQKAALNKLSSPTPVNKFRQDYNTSQANVNKNLDQNFIMPQNNKYPEDIFADRITNYNYITDNNPAPNGQTNVKTSDVNILNNVEVETGDIISNNSSFNKRDKKINKNINKNLNNNKTSTRLTNVNKENQSIKNISNKKNTAVISQSNTTTKPKNSSNLSASKSSSKSYYIQIGIFSEKKNADAAYNKYIKIGNGIIEEYTNNNRKKYKVLLGPYSNKNIAERDLEKVIKTGHYDVYITEHK